jgi:hypothetical protein
MFSSEVLVRRFSTRRSALRLPLLFGGSFRAVAWHSSGAKKRAARTTLCVVIAGLDPRLSGLIFVDRAHGVDSSAF